MFVLRRVESEDGEVIGDEWIEVPDDDERLYWDERLHPRVKVGPHAGRFTKKIGDIPSLEDIDPDPLSPGDRHVRFHMKDGSSFNARITKLDLNITRAEPEDKWGRRQTERVQRAGSREQIEVPAVREVSMPDVERVEELQHIPGRDGLQPRESLTDGPAREHLDTRYLGVYGDSRPWVGQLTDAEEEAMNIWYSQAGYSAINDSLRRGDEDTQALRLVGSPAREVYRKERTVKEWASLIDSAMAKAPPNDDHMDVFVFRGIRQSAKVFGPDGPKVGQRVTDPGYVATTTEEYIADNFAQSDIPWMKDDTTENPVIMEIAVPPGTKGAWSGGLRSPLDDLNHEWTLPRGSTFEVTGMYEKLGLDVGSKITVVEARLVPSGEGNVTLGISPASYPLTSRADLDAYYQTPVFGSFEEKLSSPPEGVSLKESTRAVGLYKGAMEPSAHVVLDRNGQAVKDWAGQIGKAYNQDSVGVFRATSKGKGRAYRIEGIPSATVALEMAQQVGLEYGTATLDGRFEVWDGEGSDETALKMSQLAEVLGAPLYVTPGELEFLEHGRDYSGADGAPRDRGRGRGAAGGRDDGDLHRGSLVVRVEPGRLLAEWREELHRRDTKGRFAEKLGGIAEAIGETVQDVLKNMGAFEMEQWPDKRPDLYDPPRALKSGGFATPRKPGTRRSTLIHQAGPPRLQDSIPAEGFGGPGMVSTSDGFEQKVGDPHPPRYLFRAISEEDWQQIKETGVMRSDGRMNLDPSEGTVAELTDPSFYLPGKLHSDSVGDHPGRIVRIRYDERDGWRYDPRDSYIKTNQAVPLDRIDLVSPPLVTRKDEKGFHETRVERDHPGVAALTAEGSGWPTGNPWGEAPWPTPDSGWPSPPKGSDPVWPGAAALIANDPTGAYRSQPTAPSRASGDTRMDDLEEVMPDIYDRPDLYTSRTGDPRDEQMDAESMAAIRAARGNPDALITVYRGVPEGVDTINPGDWVSASRTAAELEGIGGQTPDEPKSHVISMQVPARELFSSGNSINEFGWDPSPDPALTTDLPPQAFVNATFGELHDGDWIDFDKWDGRPLHDLAGHEFRGKRKIKRVEQKGRFTHVVFEPISGEEYAPDLTIESKEAIMASPGAPSEQSPEQDIADLFRVLGADEHKSATDIEIGDALDFDQIYETEYDVSREGLPDAYGDPPLSGVHIVRSVERDGDGYITVHFEDIVATAVFPPSGMIVSHRASSSEVDAAKRKLRSATGPRAKPKPGYREMDAGRIGTDALIDFSATTPPIYDDNGKEITGIHHIESGADLPSGRLTGHLDDGTYFGVYPETKLMVLPGDPQKRYIADTPITVKKTPLARRAEEEIEALGYDIDANFGDQYGGSKGAHEQYEEVVKALRERLPEFPIITESDTPAFARLKLVDTLQQEDWRGNGDDEDMIHITETGGLWAVTDFTRSALAGKDGIAIHFDPFPGAKDTYRHEGGTSWADITAEGRFTHELGHAVLGAAGARYGDGQPDTFIQDRVDAGNEIQEIMWNYWKSADDIGVDLQSRYASSSMDEAWAELFAVLNTPGALEKYPPDVRARLAAFRDDVNQWSKETLLGGPRLI